MKMSRVLQVVCSFAVVFAAHNAQAFSITSVSLSHRTSVVEMTVNITTPGQPAFLYAPTQVYSNATGVHVEIFPNSGALTAIGFLQETVTLGHFPPGTYNYDVVLHPHPDAGPVGWGVRTNHGTFSVQSDPVSPLVRIDATSPVAEETSAPFSRPPLVGVFTISRTGPTNYPAPVFVQYSGSATSGVDYPEEPAMVTIPAGATSTEIRIQATPDQVPEGIEPVVATISQCPPDTNLLCATTTPPVDPTHHSATVFIRDDAGTPHLSVVNVYATDSYAVEPSSTASNDLVDTATFRIVRSEPTNDWLSVTYTLHGTARGGVDYENLSPGVEPRSHGVVIPPGRRSVTVTIQPLADNVVEGFETVVLQLEDPPPAGPTDEVRPVEYTVGVHRRAGVVIADADGPVVTHDATCAAITDGLHITFKASSGDNYRIEASSDLVNWETVSTTTATDDTVHFVETDRATLPRRFYRVVPARLLPASD